MKLRPAEIDRLTLPEVELCLAEDLETPIDGTALRSPEEIAAYAAWWKTQTWHDRIAHARDG